MLISKIQSLHFQRLDGPVKLCPGLKKVLATKNSSMTRLEIMDRLMEKLHFLRMHNILAAKNFRIPAKWKSDLRTQMEYVDELDLLEIISKNTIY